MNSIELLRDNLVRSRERVLSRVEEMRDHAIVFPTLNGGGHTLWVLGHLAYIEALIRHRFVLGEANPLAGWEGVFDGADVSGDPLLYPPFDDVLARCRAERESTLALLAGLSEDDLDRTSGFVPPGFESTFGTWRSCLQ
ncbi:MAG TPA: DinB family protein [Candidatus Eisenbacteria bacterium]